MGLDNLTWTAEFKEYARNASEPSALLPATTGCVTPESDPLESQTGLQFLGV